MPGTGLAAPGRVALGENSLMAIGGGANEQIGNPNVKLIRFVTGTWAVGGNPLDTQDNMSGGFTEQTRAGRNCNLSADCFFRSSDNPLSLPPALQPLEETPRIIVWPDFLNNAAAYIKLPVGFCLGYTIVAAGAGDVRFTINVTNQGRFFHLSFPDPLGVFG